MLGLLSWYPVMLSSLCKSFEDRTPVDSSTRVRYSSELQRLDNIERYQDGSPCSCWEGDMSSVLAKQLAGTTEKASDGGTFHHIDDTHCQKDCLLAATTMGRDVIFVAINLVLIRYYNVRMLWHTEMYLISANLPWALLSPWVQFHWRIVSSPKWSRESILC